MLENDFSSLDDAELLTVNVVKPRSVIDEERQLDSKRERKRKKRRRKRDESLSFATNLEFQETTQLAVHCQHFCADLFHAAEQQQGLDGENEQTEFFVQHFKLNDSIHFAVA